MRTYVAESLTEVEYFKKKGDEEESCSICCDDFKDGELLTKTYCNHLFHTKCIWQWIDTKIANTLAAQENGE